MILNSIEKSIKKMIFNPIILLPALILSILVFLLENYIGFILERTLADIFLFGEELVGENFIFLILTMYPIEIAILIFMGFVMITFTTITWAIYSRISNSKGFIDAVNESILDYKKAITISIFLYLAGFVFFSALIILTIIVNTFGIFLGEMIFGFISIIIMPIILFGLMLFFLTKIIFIFCTITKLKGKEIIAKSFEFSNKKMISTTLIVFIAFFAYYLISVVFSYIGLFFIDAELVFEVIGQTIGFSFLALTISHFYFLK